ncbi:ketose-bisphosphate aldolase [Thiohalophilus sp.]|uniref:ketose-bisphosphate aldolase n=1 Tax=Thiohalophilus sp. TaxID=3028392 RepID=UPI002ACDFB95|nr:ketose-bisphosphate aldolase [Thiohalophilus sp.]MDZ7662987.1 ketose-bisphosphate aldolase [Thiohalophilus sp.]
MPLVNMRDMLQHAHREQYAIAAFDLVSLDFLHGILNAAEACEAPVILSLAESHFDYFDFPTIMPAVVSAARRANVPVAIHLDHGATYESAVQGINLGCTGVMVDASTQPFEGNVDYTRRIVEMAHNCGVPVEGELGYVAGVEGEDAERHPGEVRYTEVGEAKEYVERTGVDFLAVSIGTVHGRMKGEPNLDIERLGAINDALGIPLVIHGGTGLTDQQFQDLIANGVTKINYYTALADAASQQIRANAEADSGCGYTGLVKGVIGAIQSECEKRIRQWGSAGRAAAILAEAEPWEEVEHVIVYNTEGTTPEQVDELMQIGRETLSTIPGVRRVFTGNALQEEAGYQHCWVIRFAHRDVVASYKTHPDHVAYADTHFRPVAGDRISIDYEDAD